MHIIQTWLGELWTDLAQHGQHGSQHGQHDTLNTQAHPTRHDTASGNTTRRITPQVNTTWTDTAHP